MDRKSPGDLVAPEEHAWRNVYEVPPIEDRVGEFWPIWNESIDECDRAESDLFIRIGYLHRITYGDKVTYDFKRLSSQPRGER